jgi:hypothetical protein
MIKMPHFLPRLGGHLKEHSRKYCPRPIINQTNTKNESEFWVWKSKFHNCNKNYSYVTWTIFLEVMTWLARMLIMYKSKINFGNISVA